MDCADSHSQLNRNYLEFAKCFLGLMSVDGLSYKDIAMMYVCEETCKITECSGWYFDSIIFSWCFERYQCEDWSCSMTWRSEGVCRCCRCEYRWRKYSKLFGNKWIGMNGTGAIDVDEVNIQSYTQMNQGMSDTEAIDMGWWLLVSGAICCLLWCNHCVCCLWCATIDMGWWFKRKCSIS